MRVMITGIDGYVGWPLALHLANRGHEVAGIDNGGRRRWVEEADSQSAVPIGSMSERLRAFERRTSRALQFHAGDLTDHAFVARAYKWFQPEAIVYLGEQPSAPYSMIDVHHAVFTQSNNVVGTLVTLHAMRDICPEAHLVKLGTMGEYGTPDIDIPEGFFEVEYRGRKDVLPFPRQAGSIYHLSKVHDSNNVAFACKVWRLRSTDIMQGVVYGTRTDETENNAELRTRVDFDQCFGTVVNRFCAQAAIGLPLSVYGMGCQRRGFLPLRDSMQCLALTVENPPKPGEYRVFNQFDETYSIRELAEKVCRISNELGLGAVIRHIDNPRTETEEHYYNPDRQRLLDLGYHPSRHIEGELRSMLRDLLPHRSRIEECREALLPDVRWSGSRQRCDYIAAVPVGP